MQEERQIFGIDAALEDCTDPLKRALATLPHRNAVTTVNDAATHEQSGGIMSGAGKIGKSAASAVSKVRQYKVRQPQCIQRELAPCSQRSEIHRPAHRILGENQQLARS